MQTISVLKNLHYGFRLSFTTPASGKGEIKQVPFTDIRHDSAVSGINIIRTSDGVQKVFRRCSENNVQKAPDLTLSHADKGLDTNPIHTIPAASSLVEHKNQNTAGTVLSNL